MPYIRRGLYHQGFDMQAGSRQSAIFSSSSLIHRRTPSLMLLVHSGDDERNIVTDVVIRVASTPGQHITTSQEYARPGSTEEVIAKGFNQAPFRFEDPVDLRQLQRGEPVDLRLIRVREAPRSLPPTAVVGKELPGPIE